MTLEEAADRAAARSHTAGRTSVVDVRLLASASLRVTVAAPTSGALGRRRQSCPRRGRRNRSCHPASSTCSAPPRLTGTAAACTSNAGPRQGPLPLNAAPLESATFTKLPVVNTPKVFSLRARLEVRGAALAGHHFHRSVPAAVARGGGDVRGIHLEKTGLADRSRSSVSGVDGRANPAAWWTHYR